MELLALVLALGVSVIVVLLQPVATVAIPVAIAAALAPKSHVSNRTPVPRDDALDHRRCEAGYMRARLARTCSLEAHAT